LLAFTAGHEETAVTINHQGVHMKYRSVGKSGLKISEVALGSWVTDLKGTAAENVTKETVKLAYDSGVNFFDCADAYSGGAAERFLGEVLKQYPRKELVISSKVYFPTGEGVNDRGLSRKHIFESIDQTLKNMQTDYLDMYFCHRFDETTDLTETLRAMSDLVAQGKVLYYGVSEEWGFGPPRGSPAHYRPLQPVPNHRGSAAVQPAGSLYRA